MDSSKADLQENRLHFQLVSNLVRGLVHQLRTPLSVISNDLSYFKTLLPEGECERSRMRCREITAILKEFTAWVPAALDMQRVSFALLLDEIARQRRFAMCYEFQDSPLVRADRNLLGRALDGLVAGLIDLDGAGKSGPDELRGLAYFDGARQAAAVRLSVACGKKFGAAEYESLTPFFREALNADNCSGPLTDAVIRAHGGEIRIRALPEVEATVFLPALR